MIGPLFDAAIRRHQAGALAEAEGLYRQVLAIRPDHTDALYYLGVLACQLGRPGEAVALLERAVAADPARASAHNNLGLALQALGHLEPAAAAYRQALALQPANTGARYNLGNALQELGRLDEAAAAYREVLAADPADAEAQNNLGAVLQRQGRLPEAIADFRAAIALRPDYADAHDNLLLALNYPSDISAAEIADAHRRWGALYGAPPPAPQRDDPDPARRLRIAYVSGDLKAHSVAFFLEPLLRAHDRATFEVTCYAEVALPDAVTERLKGLADRWRSTVGLADDAVAEMIRADGIDILIDLAGHTAANRLPVFARRPAPVAATWLGYPNVTGLVAIDWRIVDAVSDPPGVAEDGPGERLLRLEHGFLCYAPPQDCPAVAPPPSLAGAAPVFGSFNNPAKLSDAGIETWAALLTRVPEARLLLKGHSFDDAGARTLCLDRFAAHGIAPERLTLRPWTGGVAEHLAAYGEVDIALDPFPYNGTTTTCEALWMGVPVICLAGDRHAGRVGESLLSQVGLGELLANDPAAYVDLAVALATDPQRLSDLRAGLRPRLAESSLTDANGFARRFEAALRGMWAKRAWLGD